MLNKFEEFASKANKKCTRDTSMLLITATTLFEVYFPWLIQLFLFAELRILNVARDWCAKVSPLAQVLKVSSFTPSKSILACQRTTPIDANEHKKRAIKNFLVNWGMYHGYPRPNYPSSCLCKWLTNKFSNRYRSKRRFSTSAIKSVAVFFSLAQKNCFWRFKLKVSRRAWLRVAEKKQKEQLESRIWLAAN